MKPQIYDLQNRKFNLSNEMIKEIDETYSRKSKFIPLPLDWMEEMNGRQKQDLDTSEIQKFLHEYNDYEYVGSYQPVVNGKKWHNITDYFINNNENKFIAVLSEEYKGKWYLQAIFISDVESKEVC